MAAHSGKRTLTASTLLLEFQASHANCTWTRPCNCWRTTLPDTNGKLHNPLTRFVKSLFLTHFVAINHQLTCFLVATQKGWRNQWLINPSPAFSMKSRFRSLFLIQPEVQNSVWTLPFSKQKHRFFSGNVNYTTLTRLFLRFWTFILLHLYIYHLYIPFVHLYYRFSLQARRESIVPKQGTFHAILPNVPGSKQLISGFAGQEKSGAKKCREMASIRKKMNKTKVIMFDDSYELSIYNEMPKSQKRTVTTGHLHVLRPRLFTVDHRLHALGGWPRTQRIWAHETNARLKGTEQKVGLWISSHVFGVQEF